jgi:hypothetical protein
MNDIDGSATSDQKPVAPEKRYAEICSNIRATDEISFKLLGLVPLVSGAGIFVLLDRSKQPAWSPMAVFVAVFGAVVAFAIYRWEIRNIQTCRWLIDRAAELERKGLGLASGQFYGRDPAPVLLGRRMGKTEAERLLYWTTIAAWLLLPIVAAVTHHLR